MEFVKKLYPHQEREWLADRDREWHAITWEQGTGKTYLTLLVAQWLYHAGKIDAVLVVAPSGVHHNWVQDEVPGSVPGGLMSPFAYTTQRAATKWHQKAVAELPSTSFPLFALSYDAINTEKGRAAATRFLGGRRCLMVLDEAHYISNAKSGRTKRLMEMAPMAPYRRVLTGTPMPDNPLNEYTLYEWLCPGFWAARDFPDKATYDSYFAIMKQFKSEGARWSHWRAVAYRNVDHMRNLLAPHSSRVLKKDVLKDLPPKVYLRRYYEMTAEQQKIYDDLRRDMFSVVGDQIVSVDRGAGLLGKLQQVLCGFAYGADGSTVRLKKNPRLALLKNLIDDNPGEPALIWAHHQYDIEAIVDMLTEAGKKVCHYYGKTPEVDRQRAKHGFMDGTYDYFVGNPGSGAGTGHTLHRAKYQAYYSNSFKWVHRIQSEDRVHRLGLQHEAVIYDFVGRTRNGEATMDERKILHKLHETAALAAKLNGDDMRELVA